MAQGIMISTPVLILPLRTWPAVLLLVAMLFTRYLNEIVEDGPANLGMVSV